MFILFTDFGSSGPYTGQVEAKLNSLAPNIPTIKLISNALSFNPKLCAYLLSALEKEFHNGSIFLCIIDPGVGSKRLPLAIEADKKWFIGPDNGIISQIVKNAKNIKIKTIKWIPKKLSSSFHGRDLFAPVAAKIAIGDLSYLSEYPKKKS